MNKLINIFFLTIFTLNIQAVEKKVVDYLFVNTSPIRANIIIDGVQTNIVTPCILREVSPNAKIILVKENYKNYQLTKTDLESKKTNINLTPISFDIFFPEKNNYELENSVVKGPVYLSNLQSGQYYIDIKKDKISFKRTSPFLPAEIVLGTSFGISTSALIGSTVMSEYYNYQAHNTDIEKDYDYYKRSTGVADTFKYASIGVTALLGLVLTGIIIGDAVYQNKYKSHKLDTSPSKTPLNFNDNSIYDTAIQYLSSGDISKSTQSLQSILSLYPASDVIPKVYYQLGQNYYISNDFENALKNWEIFIRDYPIAEYYDYILKNLSDIYFGKKDYKTARNLLDRVVFTENITNNELIFSFGAKIDMEIYRIEKNESNYQKVVNEYLFLINNYRYSERLDDYFRQLIKLYKLTSNADKISELKSKAEQLTGIDNALKEAILSLF